MPEKPKESRPENFLEKFKRENAEAQLKLNIDISTHQLETLIARKIPGEKFYYKNLARVIRRENKPDGTPQFEWQDLDGKRIDDIKAYLHEREKGQPVSAPPDEMKKLTQGFLDDMEKRSPKETADFIAKAESDETSISALQSGMRYSTLASAFLEKQNGYKFKVNLKGTSKFELYVGLGHMLPPSVQKVAVTDNEGHVRVGYRDVGESKIGYYDERGYIPVFSGYIVQVLETVDEKSKRYESYLKQERDFYYGRRMMVYSEAGEGQTVDEFLRKKDTSEIPEETMSVYRKDWAEMQKILTTEKIKVDPDTLLFDIDALKNLNGHGTEKLKTEQTLALLRRFVKKGYEFRIGDLELLHNWATDSEGQKEFQALDKKLGDARFEEFEKEYSVSRGAVSLEEAEKLPIYRRRIAENGLPFKTPSDYLRRTYRNRAGLSASAFGEINLNRYRDGTVLGRLECARFVCEMLGLENRAGFTKSSGALFASLIKGGGELITDPKNLQPGDVLFMRGTSRNIWNMISHTALVIGKRGDRAVLRHHRGSKLGVITNEFPPANKSADGLRKFYAAVRPKYTPEQLAKFQTMARSFIA